MKVQVKSMKTKRAKRHGMHLWKPFRSYHYIHAIDRKRGTITVRNKTGIVLKKSHPISCIRKWGGN